MANQTATQKRDVETLAEKLGVTKTWLVRTVKAAQTAPVQSRKGKLGQIKIHPRTGMANGSYATHVIRRLEQQVEGGKYDIAQKLQAAGGLTPNEKLLIELIMKKSRARSALVTLVAEANVDPARVVKLYAEGAIALGKAEALALASQGLGNIARNLIRQAAISHVSCITCIGAGVVPKKAGVKRFRGIEPTVPCPSCNGAGKLEETGKHYKFAVTKLLDMSRMSKPEGDVNISQSVAVQQNALGDSSGFMERLSKLTDGSGAIAMLPVSVEEASTVVDADETVLPEDSPEPTE